MSTFPQWMAAAAHAFGQWIESRVAQDYPAFRERSRSVSAQPWATIRGTMVRDSDGHGEPWLQVFADHPAVENLMAWPSEVLLVLPQPLCFPLVLAVATVVNVGVLWLYEWQLKRIIPVAEGQRSMALLVGSKQLARIQGDDAQRSITEVLLSMPEGDDNMIADACHTLDALGLRPVVEAWLGGQRMVIVSAPEPRTGQVACRQGDRAGLWMEAPCERQTESQGSAVARAQPPPWEVGRTASSCPGVHVGPSDAKPAP